MCKAVVLGHSDELKAEGVRVIHDFLGVRSRKEVGIKWAWGGHFGLYLKVF